MAVILTVVEITSGEWVGLYVEGSLNTQGSTLNWEEVLEASGVYHVVHIQRSPEWLAQFGGKLPDTLAPINEEVEKQKADLLEAEAVLRENLRVYTQGINDSIAKLEDKLKELGNG